MRILSNGNVGIGTQAPSVLFEVNGATKISTLTATSDISSSTRIWAANATIASNLVISGDISGSPGSYLRTAYGEFSQFLTVTGSLQASGNTSLLGRLGVGKSSSGSFWLDVSGNANITSNLTVGGTANITGVTTVSNDATIMSNLTVSNTIRNADGTALLPAYSFSSDPDTGMFRLSDNNLSFSAGGTERMRISTGGLQMISGVVIFNTDGTQNSPAYSFASDTATGMFIPASNVLAFSTASVERMRILSNGFVGIGRSDPAQRLDVSGTARATDFIATSDRRVKSNIETISNALDIVKGLRGVYFTRTGETQRQVGVIAQEVEEVLPEVVHTSLDDLKSVSYGNMVGVLIEALKDVSERLEKMEKKE
jgi:uncharacterized protein YaiE (UPF0345 family)